MITTEKMLSTGTLVLEIFDNATALMVKITVEPESPKRLGGTVIDPLTPASRLEKIWTRVSEVVLTTTWAEMIL